LRAAYNFALYGVRNTQYVAGPNWVSYLRTIPKRYAAITQTYKELYRFTPFSDDARPAIGDKRPLQLAGYNISQIPMAALCRGLGLD